MTAIRLEDASKEFLLAHQPYASLKGLLLSFLPRKIERLQALRHISASVEKGETVAIVGRNGAGKSTLLGLLAKVYKPSSGSMSVEGRVAPLLELGAGFHPDLTGVENVYFNGVILGLTRRQVADRMDQIIAFADLHGYIDAPVRTYSSGMLLRLGFAVAASVDADVLLVDEALSVGDAEFQQKCFNRIKQFQDEGRTILFVSHDMEAVQRIAPRAWWMDSGELKEDGPTEKVVSDYLASMRS